MIAEAAYDELLANNIEMYRFDSTEGEQTTKRRKLEEVRKQVESLTAETDGIRRALNGTGVINMGLRRRT